ncbi:unnamed protein product [Ophioblennius macclurei]
MSTSRIIGVALLLIVLVDSFSDSMTSFSMVEVRRCRCRSYSQGQKMRKCAKPLLPTNAIEERRLMTCICKHIKQYDTLRFKALCQGRYNVGPVTLM